MVLLSTALSRITGLLEESSGCISSVVQHKQPAWHFSKLHSARAHWAVYYTEWELTASLRQHQCCEAWTVSAHGLSDNFLARWDFASAST